MKIEKAKHLIKAYILAMNDLEHARANGNQESYLLHKGKTEGLELACAIAGLEPAAHRAWAVIGEQLRDGKSVPLSNMMYDIEHSIEVAK